MMQKAIVLAVLAVVIAAMAVFATGCSKANEANAGGGKPLSPLGAELAVEDAKLVVGQTTKLTVKAFIKPFVLERNDSEGSEGFDDVVVSLQLPDGLEYVSGNLMWQGSLKGDQTREIVVVAKATKAGLFEVAGSVLTSDNSYGGRSVQKVCIVSTPEETCAERTTGPEQTTTVKEQTTTTGPEQTTTVKEQLQ